MHESLIKTTEELLNSITRKGKWRNFGGLIMILREGKIGK